MTKPKFLTPKFIENAVRFATYFLALALTPLFGWLLAPIWDWVGYGMLTEMFAEIHTVLFWGGEAILFVWLERVYRKKRSADGEVAPPLKEKADVLPFKNVLALTGICLGCILLISAVIGFEVKPFYDMTSGGSGGYAMFCKLGGIGRNVFKCIFLVYMLSCCKEMAVEIVKAYGKAEKEWLVWLVAGGIFMLFGLYDVFVSVANYPLHWRDTLTVLCYLFFYMIFPLVHYLTKEHKGKSYFIILLIYIF